MKTEYKAPYPISKYTFDRAQYLATLDLNPQKPIDLDKDYWRGVFDAITFIIGSTGYSRHPNFWQNCMDTTNNDES